MQPPDGSISFTELLGLRIEEATADRVVIRWRCEPKHHQPYGIQHGGVYCSVVETAASVGAAIWYGDQGRVVGVSNQTDFLRAVRDGELTAVATPVHRGRSQQLWQVHITDEADRLVSRGQVRLQNLPVSAPSTKQASESTMQASEQPPDAVGSVDA